MRYLLLIALLFAFPLGCGMCQGDDPRSMFSLDEDERRQKLTDDLLLLKRYDEGLTTLILYAEGRPDLFPKNDDVELTEQQRDELRQIYAGLLDYMRGIDGVKEYWKDFHKFNAVTDSRQHTESFLVSYFAWLIQYKHGLKFVDLAVPNELMEKLLDERSKKHEIPEGSFASLKWNVINVKSVGQLMGAHQYFKALKSLLKDFDCDRRDACNWALETVDTYHYGSKDQLKDRAAIQFSYNAFDIVRDISFGAWFPVQKNVAEWMGDTRVARLHRHLIKKNQIDDAVKQMLPGDIIVSRHNWYLSNIGLPGFWPHAQFFIGTPDQLAKEFDDPAVNLYFKEYLKSESLAAYLESTYPDAWKKFNTTDDHGNPKMIIEAVSEGVKFSTAYYGLGADYVGVMRPKNSKVERARAIVKAFELIGRPYDFNFDFVTDDEIVCTEVVYKSWQPDGEFTGLPFETIEVMGRKTLPANDIVRQFDEDDGKAFEFVTFLDGREKEKNAVVGDLASFRKSWKRPKWDVVQE